MSQDYYDQPKSTSNPMGLIGFILSLTCCLSPLGLLFCLIGLVNPPRTFAIIGLLISLPITAMFGLVVMKQEKAGYVFGPESGRQIEFAFDTAVIQIVLAKHVDANGELPATLDEVRKDIDEIRPSFGIDPWDRPYRLATDLDNPRICSNGPDGVADTDDDLIFSLDRNMIQKKSPAPTDTPTSPATEPEKK